MGHSHGIFKRIHVCVVCILTLYWIIAIIEKLTHWSVDGDVNLIQLIQICFV